MSRSNKLGNPGTSYFKASNCLGSHVAQVIEDSRKTNFKCYAVAFEGTIGTFVDFML